MYEPRYINTPQDAVHLVEDFLAYSDREKVVAICLDVKNQPTAISTISMGTLHSSLVHPREVFKAAILSNAAGFILAHNHPSGELTPSSDDISVTERIKKAGELLGIDLLDHIIVGDGSGTPVFGTGANVGRRMTMFGSNRYITKGINHELPMELTIFCGLGLMH